MYNLNIAIILMLLEFIENFNQFGFHDLHAKIPNNNSDARSKKI